MCQRRNDSEQVSLVILIIPGHENDDSPDLPTEGPGPVELLALGTQMADLLHRRNMVA